MKILVLLNLFFLLSTPVNAVTTKMFRVLDTCARYRLGEKNTFEALEKLKLQHNKKNEKEAKIILKQYCSVFTPNEKIEF